MSTNKTQNYNLHSWLPQDEFHLAEINENFTGIDTELAVLDALLKAETAARTQQMAAKADAAAVAAKPGLLTGTYMGDNSSIAAGSQRIEVGVTPKAVLVMSSRGMSDGDSNTWGCLGTTQFSKNGALVLDDSGFTVINSQAISSRLNISGYTYGYIVLY